MPRKTKQELLADIKSIAAFQGGKCLSDTYLTAKTKMAFKCNKVEHPAWEALPNNIKNGTWCPLCKDKKTLPKKTKETIIREKYEGMLIIAKNRNGQCLSTEYGSKMLFKCSILAHPAWKATPQRIKQGSWCPACAHDATSLRNQKVIGDTRKCAKCGQTKIISQFYDKARDSGRGFTKNTKCIECCIEDQKDLYTNNKETFLLKNYDRRELLAQEVDALKLRPCVDCNIQYEPFCMDFDHIGEKTDAISRMIHNTNSLAAILAEIEKTELVCILCHKTRTYKRLQQTPKAPSKYRERNLAFILEAKEAPCSMCKLQYDHWQMEFDHRGDKENNISTLVHTGCSLERITEELLKCNLLCALCHRRKTFEERGYRTMEDLNG